MDRLPCDKDLTIIIYDYNLKDEYIWGAKLAKELKKKYSQNRIYKNISELRDKGIILAKWKKIDGVWRTVLTITDEHREEISQLHKLYIG